ncbi:hypothetical protein [Stratiformator vulcanicus]|nr:hypothetical protein [Stratiformator vulcanicus]
MTRSSVDTVERVTAHLQIYWNPEEAARFIIAGDSTERRTDVELAVRLMQGAVGPSAELFDLLRRFTSKWDLYVVQSERDESHSTEVAVLTSTIRCNEEHLAAAADSLYLTTCVLLSEWNKTRQSNLKFTSIVTENAGAAGVLHNGDGRRPAYLLNSRHLVLVSNFTLLRDFVETIPAVSASAASQAESGSLRLDVDISAMRAAFGVADLKNGPTSPPLTSSAPRVILENLTWIDRIRCAAHVTDDSVQLKLDLLVADPRANPK